MNNSLKLKKLAMSISGALLLSTSVQAASVSLTNPGFEDQFEGWVETDPTSISDNYYEGAHSAKLEGDGANIAQTVSVSANTEYTLAAYVNGGGVIGATVDGQDYTQSTNSSDWEEVSVTFNSGDATSITIYGSYLDSEGRIDSFSLNSDGDDGGSTDTDLPMFDLDPSVPPSGNFDLLDWKLDLPIDDDGGVDGDSQEVKEDELSSGFENSEFFYTGDDGGMVFKAPVEGAKTSSSTHYTRSELREMLRRGDTSYETSGVGGNNWVFSSAPQEDQDVSGGVDGIQEATLAVNAVTTTGDSDQIGRVIIGQIHANNDEPLRIYYRLLPGHTKGSIYFAHEPNKDASSDGEQFIDIIGSHADDASEPSDGIELDELFFYQINAEGNNLTVTIRREDGSEVSESVDMTTSGYDVGGQYMYFKAGVYNQNDSGEPDDYAQATFYYLTNAHEGYDYSK